MFKKIIPILPQIIASLFLTGFIVFAWTEPSQTPPNGNVPAPLNVGDNSQTKTGNLNIMGNLGIGTDNPQAKLEVNGLIKAQGIIGGSTLVNYGYYYYASGYNVSPCPAGWTEAGLGYGPTGSENSAYNDAYRTCFLCQ